MGRTTYGSTHGMSKFKEEDILIIRDEYSAGEKNTVQLAYEYEVSESAIYKIVKLMRWKHI